MKQLYLTYVFFVFAPVCVFGQIFSNPITTTNSAQFNPYTAEQNVNANITVSGIGRGAGLSAESTNGIYDASGWSTLNFSSNKYFEFTITPNTDYKIDFSSFVYVGKTSGLTPPSSFSVRSSNVNNYGTDIGTAGGNGTTTIPLTGSFQNITTSITFRIYAGGLVVDGNFGIDSFQFNGAVSCITPQTPTLTVPSFTCPDTSFVLTWAACSNASNYLVEVATDPGFTNYVTGYQNKTLGNVLTTTVSGLNAGGKYYVRLKSANSCSTSTASNVITVSAPEAIYNGSWSSAPDATKNVIFASSPASPITSLFEACSCQINSGVNVVVGVQPATPRILPDTTNPNAIMKIQNGLTVQDGGSLTFENNASLVQVNEAVNSGKIIYKRISAPMKNFDFTYWSSPVKGQILNVLSPNTVSDKYFSFSGNNWVYEAGNNQMIPGKGYIIRVPKPNTDYPNHKDNWTEETYSQPVQFEGIPNNGLINNILSQGTGNDNLIGNPYPSPIDAESFMIANQNIIGGALYFWTHNTPIRQEGSSYVYEPNDYASFTMTGAVVGSGVGTGAQSNPAISPSGEIAAGQSFFVASKADGNFIFNNAMRNTTKVLDSNSNSQFFKMSKTQKTSAVEKNRVWLDLTNSGGLFKQLLVGYITGATNEMDDLYDGVTYDGNEYQDFYSINKENKLSIQGRALPFDKTDQVPLGFRTTMDGTFEIKIDHTDGLLNDCTIYLEDKNTGKLNNLTQGSYSFSTLKGTYDNRFVLSFKKENLKTASEEIKSKHRLEIYTEDKQLNIKSGTGNISTVLVYDLNGRLLCQKKNIDRGQIVISTILPKHQIVIVKTLFEDNFSQTDKIIF